ncbi:MAG TPA: hypothetical protein VI731_11795 [Bacteroidia bacterium]|nr:hypothetical protein [Bacteroidia bacterium]
MNAIPLTLVEDRTEDRAKTIAAVTTALIVAMMLLILFLVKLITPIPAIPPDPEETIYVEVGIMEGIGGNAPTMGGGSQGHTGQPGTQLPVGGTPDPTPVQQVSPSGAITGTDQSNPPAPSGKPQVSDELKAALAKWNKNKGSASIKVGGDGSGDPYTGGIGTGSGDGPEGPKGGDPGPHGEGGGPTKCFRSITFKPEVTNPTQEEGRVRIKVYVDREGVVKKTEVDIGGTTTSNGVLRSTAAQSAYKITFNTDHSCADLIVLDIDYNFSLK